MFLFFVKTVAIMILLSTVSAHAAPPQRPIILFSDLQSAPSSGWSAADPAKGAVVTIWGRNFGAARNNSYVSVNGVNLESDSDYMDAWGKKNNPVPFLETITFQLNNSMTPGDGSITVSVNGYLSNTLPFRINSSNIKFVDNSVSGTGTGTFEMIPGGTPWDNRPSWLTRLVGHGRMSFWIRRKEGASRRDEE